MADIELVIKIPEDTYTHLCNGGNIGASLLIESAIKNGTPLTKAHDCISREDMLDAVGHGTTYTSEEVQNIVNSLPPVTPKQKTGHWIFTDECHEHGSCSECGFGEVDLMMGLHDYCRRCGARMVDPQESEDKE